MISRIDGGNKGIVDYLVNGIKQGRALNRDELDNRLILEGNIEHLNHVIHSITDKGQERYIHISLSFYESSISSEILQKVTQEYKNLLMNAYHSDEYCFYAEAHIPKVKYINDEKTGKLIERKPHIHIIIPEKNLVTGNVLNPRGKGELYIDQLDAIQEHINLKYHLVSPKDGIRISDANHANVLSRMKGDLFHEKQAEFKKTLFESLDNDKIFTQSAFKSHLKKMGEIKIYNKGMTNQYIGIKLPEEQKFIRLKSPLFSKQFIENRTIPIRKPATKQIENRLATWIEKTSHEIKHIHSAGQKLRQQYAVLHENEKQDKLNEIRKQYNEKYQLDNSEGDRFQKNDIERSLSGRDPQRSIEKPFSRYSTRYSAEKRLPSLQTRNMVYQLQGFAGRETHQSQSVLPSLSGDYVAATRQERQHFSRSVRWSSDARGINDVISQSLYQVKNQPNANDVMIMREIRNKIDPHRFLSFCAVKYNIDPHDHRVTFAKDNSPRFNVGNRNLNASDFLTKHLNLDWQSAKADLITVNDAQVKNRSFLSVLKHEPLTTEQNKERLSSKKDCQSALNALYSENRRQLFDDYRQAMKGLKSIRDERKREVERGFILFSQLQTRDALNRVIREKRQLINGIHNHWQPKEDNLSKINAILKGNINMNKNMILNDDSDFTFEKSVARKQQALQFEEDFNKGLKLADLVASKQEKQVDYLDKKTQEVVFSDKGSHIEFSGNSSKAQAAMALEYAKNKFGGKLRLTGSKQFKQTCAIAAAEKNLNIILSPDKYHQMMLAHIEKLQQKTVQTPQQATAVPEIQQSALQPETSQKSVEPEKIQADTQNQSYKIDDKAFNRLIMMAAPQNDGFENVIRFKVAFKQDDKMVMQLKDLKETDLNQMGIDTKNIDMRKVEPVYIDLASLKNSQIDSPFRHAEKALASLNQSMRNRAMPKDELEALKAQRATLEANVEEAKQKQVIEQPKQEQKKQQRQEQNSGFSL
ncbi:relaxase (plasmid) [Arsenophonus nasoniae]|uniref:Relaxase n=1 Tax=Arsenophonus nasoniae TaxID=638 RepID=A0ABY8NYF0_9GAMM|nr:LPD7 domain-containing protein [Arsenophonus nasoniae]WGM08660.1 relaxase [Arsenophonus nasoniae]WGM13438.1 relaxase [Arsenophonus nasoniae]WGM18052.1 relaxase [Arsenophonus nasoniae]